MFKPIMCPWHGMQKVQAAGPETLTLGCGAVVYDTTIRCGTGMWVR